MITAATAIIIKMCQSRVLGESSRFGRLIRTFRLIREITGYLSFGTGFVPSVSFADVILERGATRASAIFSRRSVLRAGCVVNWCVIFIGTNDVRAAEQRVPRSGLPGHGGAKKSPAMPNTTATSVPAVRKKRGCKTASPSATEINCPFARGVILLASVSLDEHSIANADRCIGGQISSIRNEELKKHEERDGTHRLGQPSPLVISQLGR